MSLIQDMLPFGMTPVDVVMMLVGLAAFMSVIGVYNVVLVRDPLAGRIRSLEERRLQLRGEMLRPTRRTERQKRGFNFMRDVVKRLKLSRLQTTNTVAHRLASAGWRSRDAIIVFLFFKFATPILLGGAAAFAVFGLGVYELEAYMKFAVVGVAAGIGFYLPDVLVKNQATKRQHEIRKALPDALDLMVICAEAGLSIDATFNRVAREMANASPSTADEYSLTAIELGFLPERSKALRNLAARTQMTEIRGMVNTLMQTEKYGTPLSQALRVLSSEFRDQRLLRAEEKAARLPAILTVPMIIFILPCLFIVLLGPAALRTIDALSGVT